MEILAEKRLITGKKVKNIRREGLVPAVIYSKDSSVGKKEVELISFNLKDFLKAYEQVGFSSILTVKIKDSDSVFKTLVSNIQKDPVTLTPLHISLFEVDLAEKVTRMIPIVLVNEEDCEPVKSGDGMLITILNEVEIECLPTEIPSSFDIDVSVLKTVGDVLTIVDAIKIDTNKIEIKTDQEEVIVKVDYAEQLEVKEEEPINVNEVEVTTEKKDSEEDDVGDGGNNNEKTSADTTDSS